jgi:PPOX class probable F420-dependent enzyme
MSMTPAEREAFLSRPRLGILTTLRDDGSPVATPVWFEWDGQRVRVFSSATSAKIRRLERDPRATLVVVNDLDEPEAWVAFDGEMSISSDGALELAERLAQRYWDMTIDEHKRSVDSWRKASTSLRVLELRPIRVRTYGDD